MIYIFEYMQLSNEFYYLDNSGSMDIICFKKNKGGIYLYNADHYIIHQQTNDEDNNKQLYQHFDNLCKIE